MQRGVVTTTGPWRRLELEARPEGVPEWGRRAFRRFSKDVEAPAPAFPCVFGVEAFREDGLRFVFVESDDDPEDIEGLARSLAEFVRWWRTKDGSAIAVYEQPNPELVSQYSVVELDQDDRVIGFEEKPERPASNLISIATYLYHRAHLALLRAYLAEGNPPDQPGHFIAWLYSRAPVYGYRFSGEWLDIGNRTQLLEADNRYRRRAGLPERDQYLLA